VRWFFYAYLVLARVEGTLSFFRFSGFQGLKFVNSAEHCFGD
jgi:hypothetical protein